MGYGGAEIVPHVRQFIQSFYGNGQLAIVCMELEHSWQLDQQVTELAGHCYIK